MESFAGFVQVLVIRRLLDLSWGGAVQICRVLAQNIDPHTESPGFTTTTSEGYSRASIDTCERWIYSWRGVGAIMASKGAIL